MPTSRAGDRRSRQSGFTYAMVLAAIVVLGIVAEVAVISTSRIVKSDREKELLFRGTAYRDAIRRYYEAGSPTRTYPRSFDDLLNDPRFPNRHHMRSLYTDPMVRDGKGEWLIIKALDGGIAGVSSRSTEEPLKKANFPPGLEHLASAKTYTEWTFEYQAAGVIRSRPPGSPSL